MRPPVTGAKIDKLMSVLGLQVTGPGAVFFTGGVIALLHGCDAEVFRRKVERFATS
jgi:hypothetical protein